MTLKPDPKLEELRALRNKYSNDVVEHVRRKILRCKHKNVVEVPFNVVRYQYLADSFESEIRICLDCGYAEQRTSCGWSNKGPFSTLKSDDLLKLERSCMREFIRWFNHDYNSDWVHDKEFVLRGACRV
jgi:hypothetical protein